jgi:Short C-terminal domain
MADDPEATSPEPVTSAPTRHRKLSFALIAVASLMAFLAIFALWANRLLLNTDNWTDTSSELLENDAIRGQISIFLVDQLYENVDIKGPIEDALPPRAAPLAGPAAGALKDVAVRGTNALLDRPRPQELWEQANRRAHTRLMNVVEGGGDVVSTEGGNVTLDLKELLGQTADRFGVGARAEARIPPDAAQITIMKSDNLELAQDLVRLLKASAIVLVLLVLILFTTAVSIASGWRRRALRAAGFGLLLAGAAALVARMLAGDAVVGALATTESVRPAAEAAWSISTSLLVEAASATLLYGLVAIGSAWLAGPTSWATSARRTLAPYLREPRIAWGALAVIVLILLAWGPTPALRRPLPALVLVLLLALGVEALRRQTAREFPDASREESRARMRDRVAGVGRWMRGGPSAHANGNGNGTLATARLEQLERLGRLRDSGVLSAAEFEREKTALMEPTGERMVL